MSKERKGITSKIHTAKYEGKTDPGAISFFNLKGIYIKYILTILITSCENQRREKNKCLHIFQNVKKGSSITHEKVEIFVVINRPSLETRMSVRIRSC